MRSLLKLGRGLVLLLAAGMSVLPLCAENKAFFPEKLAEMDAAIRLAVADGRLPGGVLWLERNGESYHHAFGDRSVEPQRVATTEDTIYDAASLTKVIATNTAVMRLVEAGKIDVEAPV